MKNSLQSVSETDTVWFHIPYSPITSHSSVWVGRFTSDLFKNRQAQYLYVIRIINSYKMQKIAK
jgi:hypothetical protein